MAEIIRAEPSEDLITIALRMTASMAGQENAIALMEQGLGLCIKVLASERGLLIAEKNDGSREVLQQAGIGDRESGYSTTALRLVREKNEPLLISDTIEDENLGTQVSINAEKIRSVLCCRLDQVQTLFPDRKVYLYCDSHTSRHPFTHADLEKFKLLSQLMASLVRKSELLAQQGAEIEQLKGLMRERRFEDLIYNSASFDKCLTLVKQCAATDVPVLLVGETGTGKESLARIVHKLSPRAHGPFLAVNCGAIPANLIESELFGHEKGAFTGAVAMKRGYFEEASTGTLFLDEVGELPSQVQTHFLRVLQEGEIVRVGSTRPIKVDVRIVSATNVDLDKAVAENRFRKDLFYRLNVLPIRVPAMREREGDGLLLARYFLKYYGEMYGNASLRLAKEAEKAIQVYHWPGNVREIQNRIQRAVITATGPIVTREEIGLENQDEPQYSSLRDAREAVDRQMIDSALKRAPGNLTNAAKILGIDRKSLRLLLEKYGIEQKEDEEMRDR
jgi:transcriptional regulator with PAS, ATPase and Fis domain